MISDRTKELLKALEGGNYNAAPSRLRSGSIFAVNPPETEHGWDVLYTSVCGYPGYRPYPHLDHPRTPEQIQEVVDAAHEYALKAVK